jgi:hypothetical protein
MGTGAARSRIRSASGVHSRAPVTLSTGGETPLSMLHEAAASQRPAAAVERTVEVGGEIRTISASLPRADTPRANEPASDLPRPRHAISGVARETPEADRAIVRERAAPPRLLGDIPETSSASPMPAPAVASGSRVASVRAAGTAPAEVHVHIGRIEVTAVHEPAASASKKRATPRQTRSLSDYLAGARRA